MSRTAKADGKGLRKKDFARKKSLPHAPPQDLSPSERVDWAANQVRVDLEANNGRCPYTGRRASIQMILWRAGFQKSYVERKGKNPHRDAQQAALKLQIKAIVDKLNGFPLEEYGSSLVAPDVTDADLVRGLKSGWHTTELELAQAQFKIRQLEARIRELGAEP